MCYFTKHNHKKVLFLFDKGTVQLTSSSNDTFSYKNGMELIDVGSTLYILIKKENLKSLRNMNLISVSKVQDFHMGPLQHLPSRKYYSP